MTNANVLIIDDDPQLRKLLRVQVKMAGFKTAEAETVKEALQLLAKQEIHVVLTDVFLPDGNGVELTRSIKAAYPLIEVIAITAQGRIADGVKAIQNGAFDYIQKEEDSLRLIPLLKSAAEKALLQSSIHRLQKEVNDYVQEEGRPDIITQNSGQIDQATLILKAIHSPVRQRILQLMFKQGSASVTEILTALDMEQSLVSGHLTILKKAGLVYVERTGHKVGYAANYSGIEKIIAFVQHLITKT